MKTDGCYAAPLDNCSGDLTREHYLTECILDEKISVFENNEYVLTFKKTYSKKEFKEYLLCDRHNSGLSQYEVQMQHFQNYLMNDLKLSKQIKLKGHKEAHLIRHDIRGKSIENWCLKTLINRCYLLPVEERPIIPFQFILNYLFNKKKYEFPYGLSLLNRAKPNKFNMSGATEIEFYVEKGKTLMGGMINYQGHLFLIWLPIENSHKITRKGVRYNEHVYKYDFDMSWHGDNIQLQFVEDNTIFARTIFNFKW